MIESSEEFLEKALSAAFALEDGEIPQPTSAGPAQPAPLPESIGRYRIEALVGRGGVGLVLRGRDVELDRAIAVKILHEHLAGDREMVRRFVDEAKVGGALEHPGVVPVHELGRTEDGRPYFTMKLVEGETLASRIRARATVGEDRLEFLSIFEKICQIVGYAHSRGVVHLDIKPSNVLVGGFGEILVTDWGFAAKLAPSDAAPPSPDDAPAARARIVGTPAYMSPEQARGELERIGCRSDVFALGGMLCEILTGTPAYAGDSSSEILLAASRAWLDDAWKRLEGSPADAALIDLARRCLSPDPENRPADAGKVAAEIGRYLRSLDQRAQALVIEAAEARTRAAAERRQRKLLVALMTLGVVAAVLACAAWLWIEREHVARQREDDRLTSAFIARFKTLIERARASIEPDPPLWEMPASGARQAVQHIKSRGVSAEASAPLEALLAEAEAGLQDATRNDRAIKDLAEIHERLGDEREHPRKDADYGKLFSALGIEVDALGVEAAASRIAESPIRAHLVSALDEWAHSRRKSGKMDRAKTLVDVGNRADPDPWRVRVRAAVAKGDVPALEALAASPDRPRESAESQIFLATSLRRARRSDVATRVLDDLATKHPGVYDVHHELGMIRRDCPPVDLGESIRHFSMALALRPRSPHAIVDLGQVLLQAGRLPAGERMLEEARAVDPSYAPAWHYLGAMRLEMREYAAAEPLFRKAVELDPGFAPSRVFLAVALGKQGRFEDAGNEFRAILQRDPSNAEIWCELGQLLIEQGRFAEGRLNLQEGHDLGTARGASWTVPSGKWLARVDEFIAAEKDLAQIGSDLPDQPMKHPFRLVRPAVLTGRPLTAAKIMEKMFSELPDGTEVPVDVQLLAARAAASAGAGSVKEPVSEQEAAAWRERGRTWLSDALDSFEALADTDPLRQPAAEEIEVLLVNPALGPVREPTQLAALPPEEASAWKALWERARRLVLPPKSR